MSVPLTDGPIEYIDGFDDYDTSTILRYWNSSTGVSIATGGRNGSNCLKVGQNWSTGRLLGSQATRTVGFAFKAEAIASSTSPVLRLTDNGSNQLEVNLLVGGLLTVTRNGTLLATSSSGPSVGVWCYIEFSSTIATGTGGSFTLKINGTTVASATGVNTQATTNNTADTIVLSSFAVTNCDFDDFYSRADANFCGDCRVETKLPTGNGATNNFTRGGTDSGTNWGQVDDNPPNDDTDYVASATAGDVDLYTYPALASISGSVLAVQVCPMVRNDTAGSVTAAPTVRQGVTTFPGTTQTIGSTTYSACPQVYNNAPAGGAWTLASVNAAQFGLKRVS